LVYVTEFEVEFISFLVNHSNVIANNPSAKQDLDTTGGLGYISVSGSHKNGPRVKMYKGDKQYSLYYIHPYLLTIMGGQFRGRLTNLASRTTSKSFNGNIIPIVSYSDTECIKSSRLIKTFVKHKKAAEKKTKG
jgi:hypothetical protein